MVSKQYIFLLISWLIFSSGVLFVSPASANELVSVSTRAFVGTGDQRMVVGIEVEGGGSKRFIIAAIGPTLAKSGVSNVLVDPAFLLVDQDNSVVILECDNWKSCQGADIVEAYLLETGQTLEDSEAAVAIDLGSGRYAVHIEGANGGTGNGLGSATEIQEDIATDITPGTWRSANRSVCFNVSENGSRLTSRGSSCPEGAALHYTLFGKTALEFTCAVSTTVFADIRIINDQISFQDIRLDGVRNSFSGVFNLNDFASGKAAATSLEQPLADCNAVWEAQPSIL